MKVDNGSNKGTDIFSVLLRLRLEGRVVLVFENVTSRKDERMVISSNKRMECVLMAWKDGCITSKSSEEDKFVPRFKSKESCCCCCRSFLRGMLLEPEYRAVFVLSISIPSHIFNQIDCCCSLRDCW